MLVYFFSFDDSFIFHKTICPLEEDMQKVTEGREEGTVFKAILPYYMNILN